MKEITTAQLKEKLEADETVNLIDVREAEEVALGKIPGAIHMPLSSFTTEMNKLDKGASYIVICRSGNRSGMACQMMELSGFDAYNYVDGMMDWTGDVE